MHKFLLVLSLFFIISCATPQIRPTDKFLSSLSYSQDVADRQDELQQVRQSQPQPQKQAEQKPQEQKQAEKEIKSVKAAQAPKAEAPLEKKKEQSEQPKQKAQKNTPSKPKQSGQQRILSKRSPKQTIRYILVPANGVGDINAKLLSDDIFSIADIFKIDIIAVLGNPEKFVTTLTNRLKGRYPSPIYMPGIGIAFFTNQLVSIKEESRNGFVGFENFDIVLYTDDSQEINESILAKGNDMIKIRFDWESALSGRPVLLFASPHEASYFDKVSMSSKKQAKDVHLYFTKTLIEKGYNDLYNSLRFARKLLPMKPGYTYVSPKISERIDFVYAKDVIPVFTNVLEMKSLSSDNIKRKAILGEVVL